MAGIQNWHIILLRHLVDGVEQREEVLLRVDVLLAVRRKKDVLTLLQAKALMDVACLNLRKVIMQHLCHGRTGHIRTLLRQTSIGQVAAGVLTIRHIHVGNNIHDAAVRLLRQAFVLAAVARFHVEDRNVKPLGSNHRKTRISVPKHQHGIGLYLHHQLIALGDDIAHGLTEVNTHGIHVHVGVSKLQVLEEHTVKVIVVVLPGVRQQTVKVLAAFVYHSRQADDFRAGADDDQKL